MGASGTGTTDRSTIRDAARSLNVTEKSIQRYLAKGLLTRIKEGARTYVPVSELEALATCRSTDNSAKKSGQQIPESVRIDRDIVALDRDRFEGLLIELGELRKQGQFLEECREALERKESLIRDMDKENERLKYKIEMLLVADRDKDTELSLQADQMQALQDEVDALKNQKQWWQR